MNIFSPFFVWTARAVLTLVALVFWAAFFIGAGLLLTVVRQILVVP